MFQREGWEEAVEVLDFGVEVEVEGEVGAAEGGEVVHFGEDVDLWQLVSIGGLYRGVLEQTDLLGMGGGACLARRGVSC